MKIHIVSLGCARALVDSEGMAGLLDAKGHAITDQAREADCVVVNTCSFIQAAEEESISTILELADRKRLGLLKHLFVAGCLPQKRRSEKQDLLDLLPEVDGFLGTGDLDKLPQLIEQQTRQPAASGRFFVTSPVPTLLFESITPRVPLTGSKHFAYLKISEGCDHACTFCSIPQFRGAHRSRSMEDLVEAAQQLAMQGVVELNLIGQDSSAYGEDRYGRLMLPELLKRLSVVEGIRWIRILYAHPAHVTGALIAAIRDLPKVVKYIDIPLQHINDRLLGAMRRETDGEWIRGLVRKFREQIPGIAIRSTFIVGFPGETESELEELYDFLKTFKLDRVGMFTYSIEPKTPSEKMPDQVPDEVKKERLDRLMRLQQAIARSLNQRWLGREIEVMVDEVSADGREILGRTPYDAPEVDGQVFLRSETALKPGQFVRARVVDTHEYDLVAEVVEKNIGLSA